MKRSLLLAAITAALSLAPACAARRVMIVAAPPAPRVAVVGFAPGPGFVWTNGYWDLRGTSWAWVDGRWMRPPRPRAVWEPARWIEVTRGHWNFQRGHWR